MAYLDIISLASAKSYLGVDDSSRDTEITAMINAALSYIEKRTNHIMDAQDKVYRFRDGCVNVYDSPINTLDSALASSVTRTEYDLYSTYEESNTSNKTITLNVGANSIPDDLREAGMGLVEHYFNQKETGNRLFTYDTTRIPDWIERTIALNRRFVI